MSSKTSVLGRATVKSVASGDQIIVRGQPRGGPPIEKVIIFSNLDAGKPAKRANPNSNPPAPETVDGDYAWTARENLRKKVVGKEVFFQVENMESRNCSFGVVFLGTDDSGENLTEWSVSSGNCKLRDTVIKQAENQKNREAQAEAKGETYEGGNNNLQKLIDLQEKAQMEKVGRWSDDKESQRKDINWVISNPDQFLESNRKTALPAILEHVFNASMVRLYLTEENAYLTLSLTGIRAPTERGAGGQMEEFFQLAKYTVESKLLGKDLEVFIEGVAPNQGGDRVQKEPLFVGSLQHPAGNISELLLKEGFAKCVDWSMGMLTGDASKYRNAERAAKLAKKRVWKNYVAADADIPESERDFTGKVIQIVNTDSLSIDDGTTVKQIFLSSIRQSRISDMSPDLQAKAQKQEQTKDKNAKALYSVPYLYEAREFLRKKLIGKKVHIKVDYKRPASTEPDGRTYPERLCATVTYQGVNIAEALVSRGIAVPIKHRHDDNNKSSKYDDLRDAESKALKAGKGIYAKALPDMMRVTDISQEIPKARAFMPFLKGKKNDAVVDYVFSGSRLKLFIPKETCLITFLIGGIECPRGARPGPGQPPGDAYADEASAMTRELCQQRDVTVEVESMDKVGGFVGYIFVEKVNISVKLVEAGLSKVHYTGENGKYAGELLAAQDRAQQAKLNIWSNWTPPKAEVFVPTNGDVVEITKRNVNMKKICITEVTNNMCFYGQYTAIAEKLEELTTNMRQHFAQNEPVAGAYTAKRNDICAAIFPEDNQWYRSKVEKVSRGGDGTATVTFIDYGNRSIVSVTKLAALPAPFSTAVLSGQANEFQLALVKPPTDEDALAVALEKFLSLLGDESYSVNDENMKEGNTSQVTMVSNDGVDIGEVLLKAGFCTTVKKAPFHLKDVHEKYLELQSAAKKQHLNLWRYGDITEDDDKEFGMNNETAKKI